MRPWKLSDGRQRGDDMGMAHKTTPWNPCEECGTMINVRPRWHPGDGRYFCDEHAPASPVPLESMIEEMLADNGMVMIFQPDDIQAWSAQDAPQGHYLVEWEQQGGNAPVLLANGPDMRSAIESLHAAWRERNAEA